MKLSIAEALRGPMFNRAHALVISRFSPNPTVSPPMFVSNTNFRDSLVGIPSQSQLWHWRCSKWSRPAVWKWPKWTTPSLPQGTSEKTSYQTRRCVRLAPSPKTQKPTPRCSIRSAFPQLTGVNPPPRASSGFQFKPTPRALTRRKTHMGDGCPRSTSR